MERQGSLKRVVSSADDPSGREEPKDLVNKPAKISTNVFKAMEENFTSYSSTNEAPKNAAPNFTHPAKPAPKLSVASASDVEVEPKAVTPCIHHQHKQSLRPFSKGHSTIVFCIILQYLSSLALPKISLVPEARFLVPLKTDPHT